MKVILLGGFLGSGKTSVLLQLAAYMAGQGNAPGARVAIIENEIGDVSIDGRMMERHGFSVKNLFAGCICCTLTGDLVSGMHEIHEAYAPEWVIIETTGLAFPGRIVETIQKYAPYCEEVRTVVVVDAERYEELADAMRPLMEGQIGPAGLLLLNKTDLVDGETLKRVRECLRETAPEAEILNVSACADMGAGVCGRVFGLPFL